MLARVGRERSALGAAGARRALFSWPAARRGAARASGDEDQDLRRFWKIWTGNSTARRAVANSARGSFLRDEQAMEARVRRLLWLAPEINVPRLACDHPDLLEVRAEDLVARLAALAALLPPGSDAAQVARDIPRLLTVAELPRPPRGAAHFESYQSLVQAVASQQVDALVDAGR